MWRIFGVHKSRLNSTKWVTKYGTINYLALEDTSCRLCDRSTIKHSSQLFLHLFAFLLLLMYQMSLNRCNVPFVAVTIVYYLHQQDIEVAFASRNPSTGRLIQLAIMNHSTESSSLTRHNLLLYRPIHTSSSVFGACPAANRYKQPDKQTLIKFHATRCNEQNFEQKSFIGTT